MSINAGYMGLAQIGGATLRFSDASISAKQEVVIPDLVMGDYDHDSWYYGPISIDGSISGPIDEAFSGDIWTWATSRGSCGELTDQELIISYFCSQGGTNGLRVPQALANTLTINATAGDVANFSVDVIGSGKDGNDPEFGNQTLSDTDTRRLVTWDKLGLTITGNDGIVFTDEVISAFEISIANNVTPAYSLGSGTLWPTELIAGIRTITGSITVYNIPAGPFDMVSWDNYSTNSIGTVSFNLGTGGTKSVNVRWHRISPTATPGPVTATMAFSGVGHQTL